MSRSVIGEQDLKMIEFNFFFSCVDRLAMTGMCLRLYTCCQIKCGSNTCETLFAFPIPNGSKVMLAGLNSLHINNSVDFEISVFIVGTK